MSPQNGKSLSPRESEILLGLAKGLTAIGIAETLAISPHTVRQHLKAIYRKWGVRNRTELVIALARSGMIS